MDKRRDLRKFKLSFRNFCVVRRLRRCNKADFLDFISCFLNEKQDDKYVVSSSSVEESSITAKSCSFDFIIEDNVSTKDNLVKFCNSSITVKVFVDSGVSLRFWGVDELSSEYLFENSSSTLSKRRHCFEELNNFNKIKS